MPLVILKSSLECNAGDTPGAHYADVIHNFARLRLDQQPIVRFATTPKSVSIEPGARMVILLPTDDVLHIPHLADPKIHYELLSKPGLALSGLPTPPSKVIDTVLAPSDVHDSQLMAAEIDRITRLIDDCKMPFLLKLAQSVSGRDVYQIHRVTQRTAVKAMLSAQLGHILRQINRLNHHMHPCSLVLQEFVHGTTIAWSLFHLGPLAGHFVQRGLLEVSLFKSILEPLGQPVKTYSRERSRGAAW
ncbi:uncharacterized protein LDX57_002534 [Aspergillus melleus]|uniref:uncharacterized protein n=1 Tax=Aspergillus melleus TaxID=138277 RepID=UPI001E8D074D|nr:uncharacterized protein LDX57_002534 [Aspergillus melleus]KAH8424791.1 hypothetical protein LDX57_002534 [Aspergillus melleus]